jgi:16S rRNA (guanine966-N2)-methyltransferase
MRVIAGIARGRSLRAPKGRSVRPTADRVKEAVFSILQSRFATLAVPVLDLFAGSGNLGIEALSRGATDVVFVEPERAAAAAIRGNLAAAGFSGEVLPMTTARALAVLAAGGRRFGGVFMDPPYHRGWVRRTLAALATSGIVEPGGWVVVEHGRDEEPAERVGTLVAADHRRYGDTRVALFIAAPAAECEHGVA